MRRWGQGLNELKLLIDAVDAGLSFLAGVLHGLLLLLLGKIQLDLARRTKATSVGRGATFRITAVQFLELRLDGLVLYRCLRILSHEVGLCHEIFKYSILRGHPLKSAEFCIEIPRLARAV